MDLFILRHGKAEQRSVSTASDYKRKLTSAGKKEMDQIAKSISKLEPEFDNVLTSPLFRAMETAEIVSKKVKIKAKRGIEECQELRPESPLEKLYERLSTLNAASKVLIVGHEPFLSNLIGDIITGGQINNSSNGHGQCNIVLKKGGIARINLTSFMPTIQGELLWLLAPKHLRDAKPSS